MREAALAARGDEVMSLHEATRAAHAQNNQYVMDLQVGGGGEGKERGFISLEASACGVAPPGVGDPSPAGSCVENPPLTPSPPS